MKSLIWLVIVALAVAATALAIDDPVMIDGRLDDGRNFDAPVPGGKSHPALILTRRDASDGKPPGWTTVPVWIREDSTDDQGGLHVSIQSIDSVGTTSNSRDPDNIFFSNSGAQPKVYVLELGDSRQGEPEVVASGQRNGDLGGSAHIYLRELLDISTEAALAGSTIQTQNNVDVHIVQVQLDHGNMRLAALAHAGFSVQAGDRSAEGSLETGAGMTLEVRTDERHTLRFKVITGPSMNVRTGDVSVAPMVMTGAELLLF